ncbi:MAG: alanine dehydrogenase [Deltaproteobacteria bacterium]|nr:alanine dehydrogenase [Deltaproteobacteria bacterium]
MIIGVPKEVKIREYRVGMVPGGVHQLVARGHKVLIEKDAGIGSGIPDDAYLRAGAEVLDSADEVWSRAEMIVKVKEPIEEEYPRFKDGLVLYTYLHLAPVPKLTKVLMNSGVKAVAYETIQLDDGFLPLLKPMSEIAGRMATQVGAGLLEKEHGGRGVLLGGVPGVTPGRVVVVGGGVVGTNAARIAVGLGADVTLMDISLRRLTYLDDIFGGKLKTIFSDPDNIRTAVKNADLVVGAVLIPGAKAPHLVTEAMVKEMPEGAVIVDVAIDQGGCIETAQATTHDNPTIVKHGVIHYGVTNMPGAVARTSTFALTNATIQYAVLIADFGLEEAIKRDRALARGVNVYNGKVTCKPVADSMGVEYTPMADPPAGPGSVPNRRRS